MKNQVKRFGQFLNENYGDRMEMTSRGSTGRTAEATSGLGNDELLMIRISNRGRVENEVVLGIDMLPVDVQESDDEQAFNDALWDLATQVSQLLGAESLIDTEDGSRIY